MNETGIINQSKTLFEWTYYGLVVMFFVSLIFSFRIYVSITSISLLFASLIYHFLERKRLWNKTFINTFILGCFIYVLLQGIALLYTDNLKAGMTSLQMGLGLIALPLAVSYTNLINKKTYPRIMSCYIVILFTATIIALAYALRIYEFTGQTSQFFYHPLVSIYSGHAIQFSILVFIGILYLKEEFGNRAVIKQRGLILFGLVYFSCFLFLLTSKLILVIYFCYIVYLVLSEKGKGSNVFKLVAGILIAGMLALFTLTDSPLKKRMFEEAGSNIAFLKQASFTPGDYITGVEFRLLSWRFVYEILQEKHCWLKGVSPGDAQKALDDKYRQMDMFIGGSPENKTGFLGYHTHNQFLQALLETGIPGLVAFIIICAGLIQMALKSRNQSLILLSILLICYCFADAILKTQYGVILIAWFPLFILQGQKSEK